MARYELLLRGGFSAAHRLKLHDGTYEPLHGHNWAVEVFIEGDELDAAGMLADFTALQPALSAVLGELHDTYLNELPMFEACNASTEHVARYICHAFAERASPGVRIAKVRVWETPECAAAYVPASEGPK